MTGDGVLSEDELKEIKNLLDNAARKFDAWAIDFKSIVAVQSELLNVAKAHIGNRYPTPEMMVNAWLLERVWRSAIH